MQLVSNGASVFCSSSSPDSPPSIFQCYCSAAVCFSEREEQRWCSERKTNSQDNKGDIMKCEERGIENQRGSIVRKNTLMNRIRSGWAEMGRPRQASIHPRPVQPPLLFFRVSDCR